MNVYIVVIKSLVIALRTLVVSSLLFSASLGALIADITVGLHASGIVNFRVDKEVGADTDADGVEAQEELCADDDGVDATDNASSSTSRFF